MLTAQGEIVERRIRSRPDRFEEVLGGWPRARSLIEASTESEWVARCLEGLGREVIVADPRLRADVRHPRPGLAIVTGDARADVGAEPRVRPVKHRGGGVLVRPAGGDSGPRVERHPAHPPSHHPARSGSPTPHPLRGSSYFAPHMAHSNLACADTCTLVVSAWQASQTGGSSRPSSESYASVSVRVVAPRSIRRRKNVLG